ncbi:MAG: anti-sigma factor [Armatimonadetes bacterium]|nr:anti-sigma factor [Armatimonadota bacterium]
MTHGELKEDIAAYALDALAPEEARKVEAHLRACEECRSEVAALREVAGELASGAPMVEPPSALRARVLAAVRPTPPAVTLPRAWAVSLAGAAAAVLLILAGLTVSLQRERAALHARLAAQGQVLALLASPTAKTASLTGTVPAGVRFVYDPDRRRAALVVTDLRDPGREFVYQLWLIAGQQPESAGVFRPVPGQPIIVPVAADLARYQVVAITVERGPHGVPRPTATPILLAKI